MKPNLADLLPGRPVRSAIVARMRPDRSTPFLLPDFHFQALRPFVDHPRKRVTGEEALIRNDVAPGNDDFVVGGIIVSVVRLRFHAPFCHDGRIGSCPYALPAVADPFALIAMPPPPISSMMIA